MNLSIIYIIILIVFIVIIYFFFKNKNNNNNDNDNYPLWQTLNLILYNYHMCGIFGYIGKTNFLNTKKKNFIN